MFFSKPAGICAGLATAAVLIHGYHLGTDDAEIWVPAVKQAADPTLYPFGGEFFQAHARLSLFPWLLGAITRFTHAPVDTVIFLCHWVGVFLLLLASYKLLTAYFADGHARWAGVTLLAALLSLPVAGTALPMMDPYVTSRTLSTPFAIFALACFVNGQKKRALLWMAACFLIHPQMSIYVGALLGLMQLAKQSQPATALLALFPFGWDFSAARGPAAVALHSRTYFLVTNWAWYEWLGVVAPLVTLCFFAKRRILTPLLRAAVILGLLATAGGLLLASSPLLESFTRLQPMRAFQLIYIIFFLMLGAWAGESILHKHAWRWCALFVPIAAGMFIVAMQTFPSSSHVDLPGAAPRGEWPLAFQWIRSHTPTDAVFAMDADYLLLPGEDMQGFRALAERSALADRVKDSGAVSLFPQLAEHWDQQVHAQTSWDVFSAADFRALARAYPVTWIVTRHPLVDFDCPYRTAELAVCQISAGR